MKAKFISKSIQMISMKILAFGDIHSDKRKARELAERAKKEKVDLVVITGDLTHTEFLTEGIIGPFARHGIKVLMVPGNHESNAAVNFLEQLYSNSKNIHGSYVIHYGLGFFGAGGANIGPNILSESEIEKLLNDSHRALLNSKRKFSKKVMVTHLHPRGTMSESFGFEGSRAIRKAIEKFQPDLALFSHIHEAAGMYDIIGSSRAINVGRKGMIIDV